MNEISNLEECSGCLACYNICPKGAITMVKNENGYIFPKIDKEKCVNCNLCRKVCKNDIQYYSTKKYYAAWCNNDEIRNQSASGGVITQIYINALAKGYICYGVVLTDKHNAEFIKIINRDDLKRVSNSKYVYSNVGNTYREIKDELEQDKKVLFIAMPCQIQALKNVLRKEYNKLILIDLACHGMTSSSFFEEHIEYIKSKKKLNKIDNITFRTNNDYKMTLYSNNKKIVLKEKLDPYLIGYHTGILYRESCYSCKFSQRKRVGDISVCDYWNMEEYDSNEADKGITGVLINTEKGNEFFLENNMNIYYEKKDGLGIEKIVALNKPQLKSKYREKFEKNLIKYGNFEIAIRKTLMIRIILNRIIFSKIIVDLKKYIKKIIKKG